MAVSTREAKPACSPRHLQQMRRVVRAVRSVQEHAVVAGVLALDAKTMQGEPGEWMEPVERRCCVRHGVHDAVPTRDMRQLVREHDAPALRGPALRVGRQQDHGTAYAPHDR